MSSNGLPWIRPGWRGSWPIWAGGAVFLLHLVLFLSIGMPGQFSKYLRAAELHGSGQLGTERLIDFSPLYFTASRWALRLFSDPGRTLQWLQIVLTACSAGLLVAVLRRRFSLALALLAAGIFAVDRRVLVYPLILEPEIFLLFFLLCSQFFLDLQGRLAALAAGCFAALSLATRPRT